MEDEIKEALKTRLVVPLWPHAGVALGLKRGSAYAAAARGEIPCIDVGVRKKNVATSWIRQTVGLDRDGQAA